MIRSTNLLLTMLWLRLALKTTNYQLFIGLCSWIYKRSLQILIKTLSHWDVIFRISTIRLTARHRSPHIGVAPLKIGTGNLLSSTLMEAKACFIKTSDWPLWRKLRWISVTFFINALSPWLVSIPPWRKKKRKKNDETLNLFLFYVQPNRVITRKYIVEVTNEFHR